jgi:hypothetical protein
VAPPPKALRDEDVEMAAAAADEAATTAAGDASPTVANEDFEWADIDWGGNDFDEPKAQKEFQCSKCQEKVQFPNQFLLTALMEFCGSFQGLCFSCSEWDNLQIFERKVRAQWKARSKAMGKKRERAREYTWARLKEEVLREHPNATATRELILARIRLIATKFAADVLGDDNLKAATQESHKVYIAQLAACCANPTRSISGAAWTLPNEQAQYLTALSSSILLCFVCRQPGCGVYTWNSCWVKRRASHHFACPRCHVQYRPGTMRGGRIEGQKALAIRLNDVGSQNWEVIVTTWPEGAEDGWLNRQMESYARQCALGHNVSEVLARTKVELNDLLAPFKESSAFSHMPFKTPTTLWPSEWSWSHLEHGYMAARLTDAQARMPVFQEWDKLIPLLGRMVAGGVALSSRLEAVRAEGRGKLP